MRLYSLDIEFYVALLNRIFDPLLRCGSSSGTKVNVPNVPQSAQLILTVKGQKGQNNAHIIYLKPAIIHYATSSTTYASSSLYYTLILPKKESLSNAIFRLPYNPNSEIKAH